MTIRIGMVGTGGFSRMHAALLDEMDNVEIVGICGTSIEKATAMAADFSNADGYDKLGDMLDKETVDAVYICVPPAAHGELELELIERNIPFFVEKPLGTNIEIPEKILEKLQKTSLIHSVGYHFRYQSTIDILKEILKEQKIGMITGNWNGSMPGVAWWRNQEKSGGQFTEQTTHIVDLLRYLTGEIEEISAYFGHRVMKSKYEDISVADVGTVNFRLQNGVVANISNTCILPAGVGEANLIFYTDKGILKWTPLQLSVKYDDVETIYKQTNNPYLLENEIFIDAVRTEDGTKIRSDYADACQTQAATTTAFLSAENGQSLKLQQKGI